MTFKQLMTAAGFAATTFILSTAAAYATSAKSTTALNVRNGPGTSFSVVDTLTPGEVVEVNECAENGWCYIEHEGPDGWVSSNYLEPASGGPSGGAAEDCSFSFNIGSGGPSLNINCGGSSGGGSPTPTPTPDPAPPSGNVACFYTGSNFTGSEFCHGPAVLNTLDGTFNDNIASVKLHGSAKVRLCRNANLSGLCKNYTSSQTHLPVAIRNKASSLRIFTGFIPVPLPTPTPTPPVTHSTGPINLKSSFMANLDNGNVGSAGADIWYHAVNPVEKYIEPRNGAKLALGDRSNRGYNGCKTESFSSTPISIWEMPVGSYVCVKTNEGRISQFRLNGYAGTTMKLGYTTWQ
ncbi:SH3 domain-containing protein [Maritalea mediterranea]|uniref:SH3 domain-containing protein n=1 Tax=Maritalea mediterranea TaxID=2909667 RepID=A0ABS9E4F3_9HYPH|nr:SH3 domain-containing protein [Maritalea mediterranea]MCF4097736.1 SH3 domain-containing protein [Maritalea mediterranea]